MTHYKPMYDENDEMPRLSLAVAELKRENASLQKDAELWRKHAPAIRQMLAALDVLSPLVLTRLKLQDAAIDGPNG